jgi:thymidylate kinase
MTAAENQARMVGRITRSLTKEGIAFCSVHDENVRATLERGGDLDLLVEDVSAAVDVVLRESACVARVQQRSYVTGVYLWSPQTLGFHIDLVSNLGWRGLPFLETRRAIAGADTSTDLPVLCAVDRAAAELLLSLLWGGFVKRRYWNGVREQAGLDAFRVTLEKAFGRSLARSCLESIAANRPSELEEIAGRLRRAMVWRRFIRAPLSTLYSLWSFCTREFSLRLRPAGFVLVLLGPDGSGKSTVARQLAVSATGLFNSVEHLHLRPRFLRGTEPQGRDNVPNPHARPPRGRCASWSKLLFFILDYWLGYLFRLSHRLAKGELVIWDRHIVDILVDPARARYGGGPLAVRIAVHCVPQPDLFVALDVEAAVAFARKREVSREEFERQRAAYGSLARARGNGVVVDASERPDVVASNVLMAVVDRMRQGSRWGVCR